MSAIQSAILAQFKPSPVGAAVAKCPVTVQLLSVRFTTDHGLLTNKLSTSISTSDQLDRWTPGGTKYKDLHREQWVRAPFHSDPISHTKQKKVQIVGEFEVGPPSFKPSMATIDVEDGGGDEFLRFSGKALFTATNSAKTNTIKVTLTARQPLPDKIQLLRFALFWRIEVCGERFHPVSAPHHIYVTYDTPTPEDDYGGGPEPLGVTRKRMDTAVRLVEPVDTLTPLPFVSPRRTIKLDRAQHIVHELMKRFPPYILNPDPSLANFHHPNYINRPTGGAWPMDDYMGASGECQAMVRFVASILLQLGIPGYAESVFVYAKEQQPYKAAESGDDRQYEMDGVSGLTKKLVDQPVTDADIGRTYPDQSHTPLAGGGRSMGFNDWEACLKFTHGGKTLYFPGGTRGGICENKDQVLRESFYAFVEVQLTSNPKGYKLVRILDKYT